MQQLSHLMIEDADLTDLGRGLPITAITFADLQPKVRKAARKAEVVELVRPDARRLLKHTFTGEVPVRAL